jgi:hypothetical protein
MKTIGFIFILLNLFLLTLSAQVNFYTHTTTQVGPGIIYKYITVPLNLWNINVLEIDLTNPYLIMETVKANDRLQGLEQTTSMASRNSYEGHEVVGAVNGDFYAAGGVPVNTQVVNGEILKDPINWPVLAFDVHNQPAIEAVSFSGELIANSQSRQVNGINKDRNTDELILFNSFYGASTGTNIYGTECRLALFNDWFVNDTLRGVVEALSSAGNMNLAKGKAVLSGHGAAEVFLQNNVQLGDTVTLILCLQPGYPQLKQVVGGNPKIVDNGVYTGSTNTDIHPRTAAGFSANQQILYLATVDGRLPGVYVGMSYRELADLMIYLGADEAVNLDGGGSTTMVVHGEIKNHPSDGPERAVANALLCVSYAPAGTGVAHIQVEPDNERIFLRNSLKLRVKGWDEYYHPLSVNLAEVQFTIDSTLGWIDENGLLTVANEEDSGYVNIQYQGLLDSAYIVIKGIKDIEILPKSVITDSIQWVQFNVIPTDVDNLHPIIALNDYSWSCLNPAVGTIDSTGKFKGISEGQAQIVVQYRDQADTAIVIVEIGKNTAILDSMDTVTNWTISGVLYDPQATIITAVDTPRTMGNKALRLDYQFVRSNEGRSWVYLNTDQLVYGLPDTIMIDIKSNNLNHIADLIISDDNDELFQASTGLFSTTSSSYETYKIPLSKFNAIDPASSFNFPIRIRSLQIKLWYTTPVGGINNGTLYFDNLRIKYPTITSIRTNQRLLPLRYNLYQNFPNPFNPNTTIQYEIPEIDNVRLEVYNLLGQKVCTLVDRRQYGGIYNVNFQADDLASGIYLYRLQVGEQVALRKMILLR